MTSRVEDLDRPSSDLKINTSHMDRPRENRLWSDEEIALLRTGLASSDIARSIGRTTGAVNAKRYLLTHGPRDRSGEHIDGRRSRQVWTREDDHLIMQSDLDASELSSLLGRSIGAIYQRRHRLRFGDDTTSNHECLWCLHRMAEED